MSERNFLIVRLGDNDFGGDLANAVIEASKKHSYDAGMTLSDWKAFIVGYVVGAVAVRQCVRGYKQINWDELRHIEGYLNNELVLSYERKPLHEDHDHGSACINLVTQDAWTF